MFVYVTCSMVRNKYLVCMRENMLQADEFDRKPIFTTHTLCFFGNSIMVFILDGISSEILGDPEVTVNIYCKSRNLPNTDTQNYSTDLRVTQYDPNDSIT